MTHEICWRSGVGVLVALAQCACLGWCDIQSNSRHVVDEYELEHVVDSYYLQRVPRRFGVGTVEAVAGGRIDQIGWTEKQIVVRRWPETGGPADWLVIDVRTHRTEGPFSDAEWLPRSRHADLRGLVVYPIDEAWALVGKR